MKRKVCVVTGTRADYGLLRRLMLQVNEHPNLILQIVASCAHLSPEYGSTYREIEEDGFDIDAKVEMLLSGNSQTSTAKSTGLGMIGFADAFDRLKPDIVVILGDRFEALSAATTALFFGITIAHIHGGECTQGAYDDAIRHSITKMSQLHFVAAEPYRQRVIQLGENPERVFNVGGMGVDAINNLPLLNKQELEESLNLEFKEKSLLITFHPVTLDSEFVSVTQMHELLNALNDQNDTTLIFTMPNADNGSRRLSKMVEEFTSSHSNAVSVNSMGQLRYLSCLKLVDAVVGNSSSGLLEAPALGTATINIGDRQKGRLKAESVIDCTPDETSIRQALEQISSPRFKCAIEKASLMYEQGGGAAHIVKILAEIPIKGIQKKEFYNLKIKPEARAGGL